MRARSEALAKQFVVKAQEAVAVLERLSDADWKQVTAAERWTVGVTAHHLASAFEPVAGLVTAIVSGQSRGHFTRAMLDEMNARHAQEHANCTKAETIALFRRGAATAAAVVRGLSDDQLAKRGTVFTDVPPMTAEQLITTGLIGHIDAHFGSIRKAIGN
jgi:Mycothiol maleylpyruvate isomerase N-terminal domain